MPLPGPAVGDYLKPIRDVYRREKATVYQTFRGRAGVPEPLVAPLAAAVEAPDEGTAKTRTKSKSKFKSKED